MKATLIQPAAIVCMAASAIPALGAAPVKQDKVIAHFRLSGPIREAPSELFFSIGPDRPRALRELVERFNKARGDESVVAVMITVDQPSMGWAQMQELRAAIEQLKAGGKEVFCYVESPGALSYLLAASASQVSIVPTGQIGLMGLHSESPYLKDLLAKIGLEADVEQIGEYKGAAEPFTRAEPTEETKEQMNWLLDDLYAQIVQAVAKSRRMSEDQARKVIDGGPYSAERALEAKLVDSVAYRQDFLAEVKKRYDESVTIARNYGGKKRPEIDPTSPFAFFQLFGELMKEMRKPKRPSIAVVYVDGMLFTGKSQEGIFGDRIIGSTTLRAALDKARTDETVKAVVMRVDSPGGSIVASEIIWNAAKRLAEQNKPFVVSMGNLAASGGYYVAAGGETIFSEPGTITGSIGVVGGKLITLGLWEKVGVVWYEYKRGKNADLFNTNRRWDERERKIVHQMMEEAYATFEDRVKEGRKAKLKEPIEEVARGRLFTGRQALENGLVDELGGLADAIRYAAAKAKITDYEVRVLPKPKNFIDLLMEGLGLSEDEVHGASRRGLLANEALPMRSVLPLMRQLDPPRVDCVIRVLQRIELIQQEPLLTVMPEEILIR